MLHRISQKEQELFFTGPRAPKQAPLTFTGSSAPKQAPPISDSRRRVEEGEGVVTLSELEAYSQSVEEYSKTAHQQYLTQLLKIESRGNELRDELAKVSSLLFEPSTSLWEAGHTPPFGESKLRFSLFPHSLKDPTPPTRTYQHQEHTLSLGLHDSDMLLTW